MQYYNITDIMGCFQDWVKLVAIDSKYIMNILWAMLNKALVKSVSYVSTHVVNSGGFNLFVHAYFLNQYTLSYLQKKSIPARTRRRFNVVKTSKQRIQYLLFRSN